MIGAVERKGNVVARVIGRADNQTAHHFLRGTVSNRVSLIAHDMFHSYNSIPNVSHGAVNHDAGVYVLGAIRTNTIEGFWSLMKRGIVGSCRGVSRKYLPLCVAEFQFRYNNRHNEDIFGEAMKGC